MIDKAYVNQCMSNHSHTAYQVPNGSVRDFETCHSNMRHSGEMVNSFTHLLTLCNQSNRCQIKTLSPPGLEPGSLERYSKDPGSSPGGDNVFHVNKSCFQLEDALASGSRRSPNLG